MFRTPARMLRFQTQLFSDEGLYEHLGSGPFVFLGRNTKFPDAGVPSKSRQAASQALKGLQLQLHFSEMYVLMKQNRATLFGLPNSPEAYELRDFLKRSGFPFEWIDLKTDDDARMLAGVTGLNDPRLPVCVMEKGPSAV